MTRAYVLMCARTVIAMSTLSPRHGWTIRKDDGVVCACAIPNPRHTSGMDCFTRSQVAAFKARHGIGSEGKARALLYIESFAPRSEGR